MKSKAEHSFLTNNSQLNLKRLHLFKKPVENETVLQRDRNRPQNKIIPSTSEKAVKIDVYIPFKTLTLMATIKQRLKTEYTTYEVLNILGGHCWIKYL